MEERIIERWIEKFGGDEEKLKNELLGAIKRGRKLGILAAKEAIKRFPTKEILYEILKLRSKGVTREIAKEKEKIKVEAAKIAKERGFIDERFLFAILEEVEDKKLQRKISREYLRENQRISKELLKEIVKETKLKEATKRLLKIANTQDDLLIIIENATRKIQLQAVEKLFKIGISKEDFVWLVAFSEPKLAEIIWQRGKEIEIFKTLDVDDLYEIGNYTESPSIKREILILMWLRREEITEEKHLEFLKENANLVTIEKPEIAREWAEKRMLLIEELILETVLKIQETTKNLEIKLEATEIALEKIKSEMAALLSRAISEDLTIWEKKRLKFLKEKMEDLEREYAIFKRLIYSSP